MSDNIKKCNYCGKDKKLSEFGKFKNGKLEKYCNRCGDTKRRWREKNKEHLQEQRDKRRKTSEAKLYDYKRNAKTKGLLFELDFKTFESLVSSNCKYCGQEGFGVDRVDSSRGYFVDNCVPCCKKCNMMKLTHSTNEFYEHALKIVKHLGLM